MNRHVEKPTLVEAAGNIPKLIEEFVGLVNSGTADVSVVRMKSPAGWEEEPGQTPDFDEYTVVLAGSLRVEMAELPLEPHSTPLSGAGGALDSSVLRVGIGFIHDEGQITFVSLPVAVLTTPNMPSLLGRDILSLERLHIDEPAGTAQLDLPPGIFRLPDRP